MARPQGPTEEAIAKVDAFLAEYEASGLTQRQYCQREGIPLTTFAYYIRRRRELRVRQGEPVVSAAPPVTRPPQQMLRVKIEKENNPTPPTKAKEQGQAAGFVLTLAKGRKLESGWDYAERDLAKLIRVVEGA